MAIIKAPSKPAADPVEQFIQAAPDGDKKPSKAEDEKGVQITLRMTAEQLERLTQISKQQGITRAAYMKRAIFLQLQEDEKK